MPEYCQVIKVDTGQAMLEQVTVTADSLGYFNL